MPIKAHITFVAISVHSLSFGDATPMFAELICGWSSERMKVTTGDITRKRDSLSPSDNSCDNLFDE